MEYCIYLRDVSYAYVPSSFLVYPVHFGGQSDTYYKLKTHYIMSLNLKSLFRRNNYLIKMINIDNEFCYYFAYFYVLYIWHLVYITVLDLYKDILYSILLFPISNFIIKSEFWYDFWTTWLVFYLSILIFWCPIGCISGRWNLFLH